MPTPCRPKWSKPKTHCHCIHMFPGKVGLSFFFFFFNLFIWLHQVFVAACRIFSRYIQSLGCGMWDLVPWPGIEPGTLHWALAAFAIGPLRGSGSLLIVPGTHRSYTFWKSTLLIFLLVVPYLNSTLVPRRHPFKMTWCPIIPRDSEFFF